MSPFMNHIKAGLAHGDYSRVTQLLRNIVMSAISPQVFSLKVMFDAIFYEGKRRIFQYS